MRKLSPRELQVFADAKAGMTSRESAEHLGLAMATVQTHRMAILRKTNSINMANAVYRSMSGNR